MAMSIPTFWGGMAGAKDLQARLTKRAGVAVSLGSLACAKRCAMPAGAQHRHSGRPISRSATGRSRASSRRTADGRRGAQPQAAERGADQPRHHGGSARRPEDASRPRASMRSCRPVLTWRWPISPVKPKRWLGIPVCWPSTSRPTGRRCARTASRIDRGLRLAARRALSAYIPR